MKKLVLITPLALLLAGCASSKLEYMERSTKTAVELNHGNYRMVKAAATGQSYGFRFLGILPFASPSYARARQKLYESVGESARGRSVALVNEMEDKSTVYLLLFSIPKRTLSADVIEFTDKPVTPAATVAMP